MLTILRLLGLSGSPSAQGTAGDTDTIRRITEALDRLEPGKAKYLAAFAYLLSRAARADSNVSDEETRAMERIVMRHGGLPEEQAILVVQIAKTQGLLFGGTDDFLVAREFEKMATKEQKIALLHCLFAVSAADRTIRTTEDNEIRRIASELRIEHGEFVAVRLEYREHLAVLKKADE